MPVLPKLDSEQSTHFLFVVDEEYRASLAIGQGILPVPDFHYVRVHHYFPILRGPRLRPELETGVVFLVWV